MESRAVLRLANSSVCPRLLGRADSSLPHGPHRPGYPSSAPYSSSGSKRPLLALSSLLGRARHSHFSSSLSNISSNSRGVCYYYSTSNHQTGYWTGRGDTLSSSSLPSSHNPTLLLHRRHSSNQGIHQYHMLQQHSSQQLRGGSSVLSSPWTRVSTAASAGSVFASVKTPLAAPRSLLSLHHLHSSATRHCTAPSPPTTPAAPSSSPTTPDSQHQSSKALSTAASPTVEESQPTPDGSSVMLSFEQGLPHLTVPLPSRKELCRFPLRPVTHTVSSLVTHLQTEDKGIDRVLVRTTDGTRIASSASIESLLLSDFDLVINDVTYRVTVPEQHRHTGEEVTDLDDVRQLVNKLYAALHVDEHQIARERDILQQIEGIRTQLIPLEKHRSKLAAAAERRTTVLMYCGLGYMALQFGFLARLTWWEYSWDIMEPVTYFVTYGTAIACYAYYVLTKHDFILPEVRDRQFLIGFHRKARKSGLDVMRYNHLKDRLFALEADLQRLRDPLSLNLPPQHLAKVIAEEATSGSPKTSPLWALQHQLKTFLKLKK